MENHMDSYPLTTEVKSAVELIYPMTALRMLKQSEGNRPESKSHIEMFAREMAAGKWEVTGQGISFDINGRLIDGHHRLRAVAYGDVPVPMLVTRGLRPEAIRAVDVGLKSRSVADVLGMSYGMRNGPIVAAIARTIVLALRPSKKLTVHEVKSIFDAGGDHFRAICGRYTADSRLTRAVALAPMVVARPGHESAVDDFATRFFSGDSPARSAVRVAREQVLEGKIRSGTAPARLDGYRLILSAIYRHETSPKAEVAHLRRSTEAEGHYHGTAEGWLRAARL